MMVEWGGLDAVRLSFSLPLFSILGSKSQVFRLQAY